MEQEVLDEEVALLGRRPVEAYFNWIDLGGQRPWSAEWREFPEVSETRISESFPALPDSVKTHASDCDIANPVLFEEAG